jgi:hypothetical protein
MSTYGVHSAVGAWDDFSITSLGAIFLDAGVNTLMVTVSGGIYTDYLTFVYDSNYNMDDQTIPTYTYANKQSIESNPVTGSGGRTESGYRTVAFNGDWYEYNVFVLDDGIYNASIRMAGNLNEGETGQTVTVSANGASISGTHTAVGDWSEYSVTDLGNIYLKKGLNTIRVSFMGTSYTDYLRIKLKQGSGGLPLMASVSYGKTEQEAFISIINLSDVGFNGFKVITASYDGFRLKEVYIAQKSISAGGSLEFSQGIELLGGEALKVFCWQDTDGVEPLSVQSEMTLDGSAAFLYVSPNGDDGGDGSAGAPYKTLVKAKQEAELRSASSDVAVNIAAGEYNLSAPLDFTPFGNNKIVFRGADKENTVISGGVKVSGWTDTGSGNIWKAPVTGASDVRQFYVNGKKAVRARSEGTFKGAAYYNVSEGVYVSRSVYPAIAALEGLTGAEAVCDAKWSRAYLPVDSVTPSGGSDIVKIKSPCLANAKVNFPGTSGTMTTYPFYIENALVLLDQPGEFYYDKTGRTLYYCPKADETLSASDCVAGVSEGLITINGASNNKVKNLIFENLTFAYGTWLEPASEGAIPRQSEALLTDAAGGNEASKMLPAQISVNWAENIVFKNNIIKNVGSSGIGYFEGVSSSEIIGNAFNGIGAAAVVISSFKTEGDSVRMANNCTVSNNLIRNTGTDYPSSPAISVYFAHHVNILHNDVADTSYHGISLGWCWNPNYTQSTGNVISYNKVKDVMKTVDDGAPMYTLGSQGDSRITYNHFGKSWENNKSGVGYHGGIYFDEGSSSLIVNHNVIEQAKNWFFSWDNINPSVGYGDYHYNKVTDNWADTAVYENKIYSGFDNVFQQATVAAAPNWPAGAQAVIDGAGLEATYAGLHDYLIHN